MNTSDCLRSLIIVRAGMHLFAEVVGRFVPLYRVSLGKIVRKSNCPACELVAVDEANNLKSHPL